MTQKDKTIKNRGYIDIIKASFNTRILSINTCGFSPSNNEKIKMMIANCKEMQIDILLLNETNMKWTQMNQDWIIRRLKALSREINVKTADSGRWELTKKEWLPEGVLTAVKGKISFLVEDEATHRGNMVIG